ncbi:MAG TPA: NUDIX domain-containing protein [Verrucomicrobiae bacterium]|nr:NUDIX domain-containing protein [Verrucomicrobiae bacterium]
MEMIFCRRCGKPLSHLHDHVYRCPNDHTIYANQSPSVGIFFVSLDNQKVPLATRGIEPHKGMLDAFGGFLDAKESFEDAAARELREELHLNPEDYQPLVYLTSEYDFYPYQDEPLPVISVLFWTRFNAQPPLHVADDVSSADWYELSNIDPNRLHANDIRKGIRQLHQLFNEEGTVT